MNEQQLMEMQGAIDALMQIRKRKAIDSAQMALSKAMEYRKQEPKMGYYGMSALDLAMDKRELMNMMLASPQARVASGANQLQHVSQYGHSQSKNVLYRR
jgi:hypothetical protein